jgi:hypothetical protein
MTDVTQFQFTNPAVPRANDEFFVPSLFEPWAVLLLDEVRLRPAIAYLMLQLGRERPPVLLRSTSATFIQCAV